jgi:hypothetical protein
LTVIGCHDEETTNPDTKPMHKQLEWALKDLLDQPKENQPPKLDDLQIVKIFDRLRWTLIKENIVPQKILSGLIFKFMKYYLNEERPKEAFEAFINCAIVANAYDNTFTYFIELSLKGAQVLKEIEKERPKQKPWQ